MKLSEGYRLDPHPSGKATCRVATFPDGNKAFVKFPRTVEDEAACLEELFSETLAFRILRHLGICDLDLSIERVGPKLAVVTKLYPKDWRDVTKESLRIDNFEDWPIFLAAEAWMRQQDRSPDKHEHVGAFPSDSDGGGYRAGPLDLGHSFIGQPSGYNGLDEDMNPEWVKTLFWTDHEFSRQSLQEEVSRIDNIPVVKVVGDVVEEILSASNWPKSAEEHLRKHADKVAYFLLVRKTKLEEALFGWWDQTHTQTETSMQEAAPAG